MKSYYFSILIEFIFKAVFGNSKYVSYQQSVSNDSAEVFLTLKGSLIKYNILKNSLKFINHEKKFFYHLVFRKIKVRQKNTWPYRTPSINTIGNQYTEVR